MTLGTGANPELNLVLTEILVFRPPFLGVEGVILGLFVSNQV